MKYEIITPDSNSTPWRLDRQGLIDVIALDGAGIPVIARRQQSFANAAGALDYGFRLQSREMTLKLLYQAQNRTEEDARRDLIYKIFQPYDYPLKLRCTRDNGSVRQIDCHTVGAMDLPQSERLGSSLPGFAVRLLAPNPIWYDPMQWLHSYTPSAGSGSSTTTLTYTGGWDEYPIIKLYGLMTAPALIRTEVTTPDGTVIYQISTSATIPAGDVWTIDLQPGYKTVTDLAGNNKLPSINSFAAYLLNFRLFAEPIKSNGDNVLTLSYAGKDANTKMEVLYYNRFLGI